MIYCLDWISSGLSLWAIYVLGKKQWWGWVISFFNTFIFFYMNVHFKLWGLMPANFIALWIFVKNTRSWYRDSH